MTQIRLSAAGMPKTRPMTSSRRVLKGVFPGKPTRLPVRKEPPTLHLPASISSARFFLYAQYRICDICENFDDGREIGGYRSFSLLVRVLDKRRIARRRPGSGEFSHSFALLTVWASPGIQKTGLESPTRSMRVLNSCSRVLGGVGAEQLPRALAPLHL